MGRFASRLALLLVRVARRVLPLERREWADAMDAELAHLPKPAALAWACGCVLAAFKARLIPMHNDSLRFSRWVMFIETLGCFGPATIAWLELTFGASGLVRLNAQIVENNFFAVPGGTYIFVMWCATGLIGLFAPIGLFLGLRYVLLGRALSNRVLGYVLIAAPVLQTTVGVIVYLIVGSIVPTPHPGLIVLGVVMPVAALWHLMYLAKPADAKPGIAGLAVS